MTRRLIAAMLCIALLLSLTACAGGGTETAPPTTVPPTTTEPAPDAAEVYNAAVEKIESAESMLINYTLDSTMILGNDTYQEKQVTSLSLSGIGTDGFAARADAAYTWGEVYYADILDVYSGGTVYGKADDNHAWSAPMSPEDFLSGYLPGVILTAELYETVEMLDENTISFSGATALEPWLAQEGCQLAEASGTACIDAAGAMEECTYDVRYIRNGVEFQLSVSSRVMTGTSTVKSPADPSAYPATEAPNAVLTYERAIGLMLQSSDLSASTNESIVIQAGDIALSRQGTMNSFGTGADLLAGFNTTTNLFTISTGASQYAYVLDEQFRNGAYTSTLDGGTAESDPSVTADDMLYYCKAYIGDMLPLVTEVNLGAMTDTGATMLLEYTLTPEAGWDYSTMLCGSIYEDPMLLHDLASDFRTEATDGYLGIDKLTGLPTALGMNYLGIHTIEGTEYTLAYDLNQTISIGTGASYEELTGEALPVEVPEQQATPLLYRVTGENGEQMWLFGTIHVGDARTAYLPRTILDAFAASDALAVEFDTDSFLSQMESDPQTAAQIAQYMLYIDGTTIANHLQDAALAEQAAEILKSTGNYNATLMLMKPILLAQSVENDWIRLSRMLSADLGMDAQLMKLAEREGKEILEVESGEFQMKMLGGYSDALQELLLKQTLEYSYDEYMAELTELYELWCSGDEDALTALINREEDLTEEEAKLYEEYIKAMSTDRNAAMLDVALEYLSGEQTVFYAVGLAHLLAEDGLVNTLRQAGYTVEPVPCN